MSPPPLDVPLNVSQCEIPKPYFSEDQFRGTFFPVMSKMASEKKRLLNYLKEETKDCQQACMFTTVARSVYTLLQNNNFDKRQNVDAITGAIQACYPGISPQFSKGLVRSLVAKAGNNFANTNSSKLYADKSLNLFSSMTSISMYGFFVAATLVVFFASVLVGKRFMSHRRSRDTAYSDIEMVRQEEVLLAGIEAAPAE